MSNELFDRESTRDKYLFFCFAAFLATAIIYEKNNPTWLIEIPFGFFGGTLFSYLVFCCRHRQRFFHLPLKSWEAINTFIFFAMCILLIAATLWVIASGGSSTIVIGALIGQAIFQATYESWWDEEQKSDLKRRIKSEFEIHLNTKIDALRQELTSNRRTNNQ